MTFSKSNPTRIWSSWWNIFYRKNYWYYENNEFRRICKKNCTEEKI